MASKYFFSLDSLKPKTCAGGSLTYATAKETPGLVGISFANLKLNPHGSVEPIWHANANKVGYCTEGKAFIMIRTPEAAEFFSVKKGDMFFIPEGYVHHIENIGSGECTINFALDNSYPETMRLSKALFSISDSVFNSTFNKLPQFVDGLKRSQKDELINLISQSNGSGESTGKYKFDIGGSNKVVLTKGGYLQIGTVKNLPLLKGLGILSFGLNSAGIVEPHWHTNAGELVYIVKGKTRITVLTPDGAVDTMEVGAGQGAFAPASYFHNIENIGLEDVEVIAYFSNENPDYIGIGEVVGSYSNELLGSVFNTSPSYFDNLKKPETPLIIVPV